MFQALCLQTAFIWWYYFQAEPYEAYRTKQFKFMNIANRDFSTACQAPKYKDD